MSKQQRSDIVGLTISLGLHVVFLLLLSLVGVAATEPEPLGFIEVDFGPVQEGRPVRRAPEAEAVEKAEVTQDEVLEETDPEASPPAEASPVELPEENPNADEEEVEASDSEVVSPETDELETVDVSEEVTDPTDAIAPLGAGVVAGSGSEDTGDEGSSNTEALSSPFQIEGLNRSPVSAPLPVYTEKVNALIRIRITVDPDGRVVNQIPLIKGSASLEQSVMDVLRKWRFSPLPPTVPRENQVGVVTFRFRLE